MHPNLRQVLATLECELPNGHAMAAVTERMPPGLRTFVTRRRSGSAHWITRYRAGRARADRAGINAADPAWCDFLLELVPALEAAFPPSGEAGRLLEHPGIVGNWSVCRTIAGLPPRKGGVMMTDNRGVPEARLRFGMSPRLTASDLTSEDRALFRELLVFMVNHDTTAGLPAIPIKRATSVGPPWMTNDNVVREQIIQTFLSASDRLAPLVGAGRLEEAYHDYGYTPAMAMGVRMQEDEAPYDAHGIPQPKKRVVESFAGGWGPMDKQLPAESPYHGQLFAGRERPIAPFNLLASLPSRVMARMVESYISQHFGESVKAHGLDWIEDAVSGADDVLGCDGSGFDATTVYECITMFIDRIGELFGQRCWADCYDAFFPMALLHEDETGKAGARVVGSLFSRHNRTRPGIPSGTPWTAIFGKVYGFFNMVVALRNSGVMKRAGSPDWRPLLQGSRSLALRVLNSGDDNLVAARFQLPDISTASPYLDLRAAPAYLGGVITRDRGGVHVLPNLVSRVVRSWVPGRSADDPQRGWWANGEVDGKGVYDRHPEHARLLSLMNSLFESHFGVTWSALAQEHYDPNATRAPHNEAEREYVADPDVAQWKFTEGEIGEDLLEARYRRILPAEYETAWKHWTARAA